MSIEGVSVVGGGACVGTAVGVTSADVDGDGVGVVGAGVEAAGDGVGVGAEGDAEGAAEGVAAAGPTPRTVSESEGKYDSLPP